MFSPDAEPTFFGGCDKDPLLVCLAVTGPLQNLGAFVLTAAGDVQAKSRVRAFDFEVSAGSFFQIPLLIDVFAVAGPSVNFGALASFVGAVVKPPCYGPVVARVSGTGGLMLRA